jgi:sugar O-acyltransferase (sialic acid O-acetyltransferase NeuD family)
MYFIDDLIPSGSVVHSITVLSFQEFLTSTRDRSDFEIIIAHGEPRSRKRIREKLAEFEVHTNLISLISPDSRVSHRAQVEKGSIVCPGVQISVNTYIGLNSVINCNSIIGHDVHIGDDSVVSSQVNIGGGVKIAPEVYIGMGCLVKERLTIGKQSILGMASVLFENVPEELLFMGNPAKGIRRAQDARLFNE